VVLNCIEYRPNPQPLPYKGRGVKFKASLILGERAKWIASIIEKTILYLSKGRGRELK
jgi:hypothetical protein